MRSHDQFIRRLQQLLYSVSEVEGMITADEALEIIREVKQSLESGKNQNENDEDSDVTRAAFHTDAPNALKQFMAFIDSQESAMDDKLVTAFGIVAGHLSGYYAVTSKKEKELLADLKKKAATLMQGNRRKPA